MQEVEACSKKRNHRSQSLMSFAVDIRFQHSKTNLDYSIDNKVCLTQRGSCGQGHSANRRDRPRENRRNRLLHHSGSQNGGNLMFAPRALGPDPPEHVAQAKRPYKNMMQIAVLAGAPSGGKQSIDSP